ncbi:MAG TPA: glycosyltransferase family 2 protein [Actinoplanes sp.]|nr:glycosyltransferase family 2 protein [Actinoplanes sp.]
MTVDTDASVIVVSYNTREHTLRCLRDLLADEPASAVLDVIVVDNASGDGSADAIAAEFPAVRLLRLEQNVGWGRAVNRAAELSRSDYLLLLNPDTRPVGDVVGRLVAFARNHPGHGIYTGRTLTTDGHDDGHACLGLPTMWSLACFATGLSTAWKRNRWTNPERLPDYDRRSVREVPAVSGCLMLVERALFHALEGFDPRYFLYSEDVDLSLRARQLGARPIAYPEAAIVHIGGASSTSDGQRIRILRGKMTYVRRHWKPGRAALAGLLLRAGVLLRCAGATVLGAGRSRGVGWRTVWRERRSWVAGYPPVDEPRPRPLDWVAISG